MTWPLEYQKASVEFEQFMVTARDLAELQTTNMAWTMVEGVLLAFRRRLTVRQAIAFANVLPPLVRALFLDNWHPADEPEPFVAREALTAEVQALRREHNFSPPNSIAAVASALRSVVDQQALSRVLASLPAEAQAFWSVTPSP